MNTIEVKIKEIREKMSWSQEDLAREVGVSLSTVHRWEKYGVKPSRLAQRELQRVLERAGIQQE
ncbi:MAG: helix-turn-helix domain-containing protein [Dehalococcoidales bacterium]|nr:helix-turn-helix domain-containing protein [Dehalococcoidales bacterium]